MSGSGGLTSKQQLAEAAAAFEERAAIIEHDGGMNRDDAERLATDQLGGRPTWRGSIVKLIEACESAPTPKE